MYTLILLFGTFFLTGDSNCFNSDQTITSAQSTISPAFESETNEDKKSHFQYLSEKKELVIQLSDDIKTITKNFEKDTITDGSIQIEADGENLTFVAEFDLGGKTRRKICKMPPVKINLKKKELESRNFVKKCDRVKIVFQCSTSKSMSESIKIEKFIYDLHNLVTPYGHKAILTQVKLGDNDKMYDGLILESDEDIEHRTNTTILKNKTIATNVLDRKEYLKMCLFQYMISNADWSARKGHNTDLFKRNEDNSLVVIPYDFDYAGLIANSYAVPPANLPISSVTQRYFMDKNVTIEELNEAVTFFLDIESDIINLCEGSTYLSKGSSKRVKRFIEEFYKIIKNDKKVKRMIN